MMPKEKEKRERPVPRTVLRTPAEILADLERYKKSEQERKLHREPRLDPRTVENNNEEMRHIAERITPRVRQILSRWQITSEEGANRFSQLCTMLHLTDSTGRNALRLVLEDLGREERTNRRLNGSLK